MQLHTEHADTNMKVGDTITIILSRDLILMITLKVILITGIVLAVAEAIPQGYAPVETYPDEPPVYTYTYGYTIL